MASQARVPVVSGVISVSHLPTEPRAETSPSVKIRSVRCSKCGTTKKSGKHSCCARGGSWFKNCGDDGDAYFDHTWAEGIQACKGFRSANSVTPPLQFIHGRVKLDGVALKAARNISQQQENSYLPDTMSNAATAGHKDCAALAKVVFCVLFVVSDLQR